MADFDAQYVKDHLVVAHTPDSWARAVTERALQETIKQIKGKAVSSHTLDVKMHVSAVEPTRCMQLCVEIGGILVCYHIG